MEAVMALLTWWRGDPRPQLETLDGFWAGPTADAQLLATLAGLEVGEAERRLRSQHRPYVASIDQTPVAYGWVALDGAAIGELDVAVTLPAGDRYLWDFATLPAWRGRGIYPRLLQAILDAEAAHAERFWIIHAPENGASQAGIEKAGFRAVGELSFRRGGGTGVVPEGLAGRAQQGAALLGVPVIETLRLTAGEEPPLAPCWHCVLDARQRATSDAAVACWWTVPQTGADAQGCTCGCAPRESGKLHGMLEEQ
jgi:RimJ/RimL family protein N-acetyltransferase